MKKLLISALLVLGLYSVLSVQAVDTLPSTPGVVNLEPRVYDFGGKEIRLTTNVTFHGVPGKTVFKNASRLYIRNDAGPENVRVDGITFQSIQVYTDQASGGMPENITIDNCEFSGSFPNGNAIKAPAGVKGLTVTNNLFTATPGHAIYIEPTYIDLTISNNEFVDCTAAMHCDAKNGGAKNVLVDQNVATGWSGVCYEFQSEVDGGRFIDNYAIALKKKNPNDCGAYSLILDRSKNIQITRNTVIGDASGGASQCPRYAFEIGGGNTAADKAEIWDNYVNGAWDAFINNDRNGPTYTDTHDNLIMNIGKNPPVTSTINKNNGPNAKLSWNPSRGLPGRNRRLIAVVVVPPATQPLLGDVPPPVVLPKTITRSVLTQTYSDGTSETITRP